MSKLQLIVIAYGIFDIVMGLIGTIFTPNHEIMSLIGGGGTGLLVIGCAVLSKTNPRVGFIGASVLGLMMVGMFATKTFKGNLYPAGLIFTVSLVFVIYLVASHFAAVGRKSGSA